jgi:hypothetical protein
MPKKIPSVEDRVKTNQQGVVNQLLIDDYHWKKMLPPFLPRRGRGCPILNKLTPPKKGGDTFTFI